MSHEIKKPLMKNKSATKDLARFYFAYRAFIKQEDALILSYGIRQVHRRIIFFIGQLPGLSITELLEVLDITKQALNGPINELKERNLVAVETNPADKRSKRVYLTDKGRALDQRMNDFQIQKLYHYFDLSGDPEGKIWNRIMQLYANEVGKKYLDLMPDDHKKDDEA